VYGGKASGRIWYQYLRQRLEAIGFQASEHDECVFYKGKAMYVLYTDDSILAGPDPVELDNILDEIKAIGLDITSEGGIEDFLGVAIDRRPDGTFHLTQQKLIQSILEDLNLLGDNVATKSTPMASSKLLSLHPNSAPFDNHFEYRRVIGKLMYLEKSTRPDLAYAVHQCARFSHAPKVEHGRAVKWLGRYLKGTADMGLILKPSGPSLDLFVDSDFAGNWDPEIADTDSSTANSRHGYILKYCGMPLLWASQLQSICALSSTEAEYVALSRAVQDSLVCIRLLQEMKALGYPVPTDLAHVHCRIFEDNTGAIEIATVPKYRPRTKHINNRYHFFRSLVDNGEMIQTNLSPFTKLIPRNSLLTSLPNLSQVNLS
jgi:histone deacetylase 1/2